MIHPLSLFSNHFFLEEQSDIKTQICKGAVLGYTKCVVSVFLQIFVSLLFLLSEVHASERPVALVIVNTSYPSGFISANTFSFSNLQVSLEEKGFDVLAAEDPTSVEMYRLLKEFGEKADDSSASVFYYAGHGITLSGNHYLVPTDVSLRSRGDHRKLPWLQEVILSGAESGRFIAILDTCRSSSLAAGWGGRLGKKPLCPDQAPEVSLPDNSSLWFSDSISVKASQGLNAEFQRNIVQQLLQEQGIMSAIEQADQAGAQTDAVLHGSSAPMLLSTQSANDAEITQVSSAFSEGNYGIRDFLQNGWLSGARGLTSILLDPPVETDSELWSIAVSPANGFYTVRNLGSGRYLVLENDDLGFSDVPDSAGAMWEFLELPAGLDNERLLYNVSAGLYVNKEGGRRELSISDKPDRTGWIFAARSSAVPLNLTQNDANSDSSNDIPQYTIPSDGNRIPQVTTTNGINGGSQGIADATSTGKLTVLPFPNDSRVRILNILPVYEPGIELILGESYHIEVSREGFELQTLWLRLNEEDVSITIRLAEIQQQLIDSSPAIPDSQRILGTNEEPLVEEFVDAAQSQPTPEIIELPPITPAERNAAVRIFDEIAQAVREADQDKISTMLPSSSKEQLLLNLAQEYVKIRVAMLDVAADNATQSVKGTLTLEMLTRANGDTVVPADSYRFFPLVLSRVPGGEWSGLVLDDG